MNWLPIETAPKNGETILLACPSSYRENGYRIEIGSYKQDDFTDDVGWSDNNGGGWSTGSYYCTLATHWMPLPEPPKD